MHGATHGHLHSLQIHLAGFAPSGEDHLQQPGYFVLDFLLDCFRRFFSSGVKVSSTGRRRQICSFTSTSSRPYFWYFRNSAISCSALRTAAGVGKASVTVLPFHL
jgi:hypothetical protein